MPKLTKQDEINNVIDSITAIAVQHYIPLEQARHFLLFMDWLYPGLLNRAEELKAHHINVLDVRKEGK